MDETSHVRGRRWKFAWKQISVEWPIGKAYRDGEVREGECQARSEVRHAPCDVSSLPVQYTTHDRFHTTVCSDCRTGVRIHTIILVAATGIPLCDSLLIPCIAPTDPESGASGAPSLRSSNHAKANSLLPAAKLFDPPRPRHACATIRDRNELCRRVFWQDGGHSTALGDR